MTPGQGFFSYVLHFSVAIFPVLTQESKVLAGRYHSYYAVGSSTSVFVQELFYPFGPITGTMQGNPFRGLICRPQFSRPCLTLTPKLPLFLSSAGI